MYLLCEERMAQESFWTKLLAVFNKIWSPQRFVGALREDGTDFVPRGSLL